MVGDESKRTEYDEVRKLAATGAGPDGFGGGGFGGFSPGGMGFDGAQAGDLGDLFGGLFNRGHPEADVERDLPRAPTCSPTSISASRTPSGG